MKIYQVYTFCTAESHFFKTKKGAKKFIKNNYKEYLEDERSDDVLSLEDYILDQGIEIMKVSVED